MEEGGKQLASFGSSYRGASEFLACRFGPIVGFTVSILVGFTALATFTWLSAVLFRKLAGSAVTSLFDAPIVQYAAAHRFAGLTWIIKGITTLGGDLYLWIAVVIGGAILRG